MINIFYSSAHLLAFFMVSFDERKFLSFIRLNFFFSLQFVPLFMKILSYPKIKSLLLICLRLSHLSSQSICKLTLESEVDKRPNEFSSNTDDQFSTPFMEQSKLSSLVCNDSLSFPEDVIRGSLLYRTPVLPSSVYFII